VLKRIAGLAWCRAVLHPDSTSCEAVHRKCVTDLTEARRWNVYITHKFTAIIVHKTKEAKNANRAETAPENDTEIENHYDKSVCADRDGPEGSRLRERRARRRDSYVYIALRAG
jgi:hypothetical protein